MEGAFTASSEKDISGSLVSSVSIPSSPNVDMPAADDDDDDDDVDVNAGWRDVTSKINFELP
jgi:hypothetical protein